MQLDHSCARHDSPVVAIYAKLRPHYNDVIMIAMASQITCHRLLTQPFIQAQMKEAIKAPRHWPLCGEFTGD